MNLKGLFPIRTSCISKTVRTIPFTNYELFLIYALIFPGTITLFISSTEFSVGVLVLAIFYLAFLGLGCGIEYYKLSHFLGIVIIVICYLFIVCLGTLFLTTYLCYRCNKKKET